jgi:hypothetical protein
MNLVKPSIPIAGLVTAVALMGCAATETAGFKRMTAPDHELAARSGQDATGATPSEHLAAAQQLRANAASACADVPEAERDAGPFVHGDRIVAVEEVQDRVFPKAPLRPFGVAVTIRATPGMTEQWLGRIIQCHVAHHAAVGTSADNQASPLLTDGVHIHVSPTAVGFKVSITSADADTAQSVITRAQTAVARAKAQVDVAKDHAASTNAS